MPPKRGGAEMQAEVGVPETALAVGKALLLPGSAPLLAQPLAQSSPCYSETPTRARGGSCLCALQLPPLAELLEE